jgi:hypothetical protein
MHLFLITVLALMVPSQNPTKTLRQVLEQYRVSAGPEAAKDLEQAIDSFLVDDTNESFFIVYFQGTDSLHFGIFDKMQKIWKHTSMPRDFLVGSLSHITRTQNLSTLIHI